MKYYKDDEPREKYHTIEKGPEDYYPLVYKPPIDTSNILKEKLELAEKLTQNTQVIDIHEKITRKTAKKKPRKLSTKAHSATVADV